MPIEYEKLSKIGEKEELLVNRTSQKLVFNGKQTVKLEATKSTIALLKEESDIMPVYFGFTHIYSLPPSVESGIRIPFTKIESVAPIRSLDELRKYSNFTPIEKLYLLYKNQLNEYNGIVKRFTEIFSFVETIDFTIETFIGKFQYPILKIKEREA